ncbi:conjugal transfer protein TraG N-terminal domain-containing protein [Citrobacter portucalensis]|uniref:conjugal transfer protein TraG N-terminal domain-containing protein n=1 Tax=Citrobacter portucalensis TaxID=1639133 RepID=UPI00226B9EFC|nr:conjugal transfer protein TraG N-terminal domain-containing protein [Citrobacter portucalensis]MCX9048727.1 conjugal transfer protein TraG N-terminal domain-containing protein [Citrobacter portucalensis]
MTADSYLEMVLVFMGWLINNALWMIITTTGIFAIPLAFKIAGVWLKVREEGDDEGNKGALALPRMEHVLYVAFVVIMFCAMPMQDIDITTMKFDRTRSSQCGVNVPKPDESGYGPLIAEFNGQTAKIPAWWYLVHSLSKGVTHAAIASIPCGNDFRLLRFEVQHTKLIDPIIREEVQEFASQCYAKSYYKLKNSNPKLTAATIDSVGWIGSDYFLNTSGYYDYYTSTSPRAAWPYSESRDSGYPNVGRGGYPTCKDWWSASSKGLKSRLLESFDTRTVNMMKAKSPSNWEESLLRWLVSPQNTHLSGGGDTYMMGNQQGQGTGIDTGIKQALSGLGALSAQVTQLPAFDALRQALPMVHAVLLMAIVVCIPLVMLFGAYDPKVVVTITFAMFALIFVPFWWELGGWLDDELIQLMYASYKGYTNNFNIWLASTGSDGWILNLVLGAMYVMLPMFWFGAVSWSGVQIGGALSSVVDKATQGAKDAGAKGPGVAGEVVKTVATKGASKGKG